MFDTDLFLILFRSFVFGDSSLISLLLDEAPCTEGTVQKLATYIEKRLFEFINCPVESLATQLEEQNESVIFGRLGSMIELERCPWEAESIRKAAADAISVSYERLQHHPASENERMFAELASSLVSQRTSMCVCSAQARYELNSEGAMVVLYRDMPISAMNTKDVKLPRTGQGRFSIHVMPRTGRQICLFEISEPKMLLQDQIIPGVDPTEDEKLDAINMSQSINSAEGVMEICRLCIEEAKADSRVDWGRTVQSIREIATRPYSRLALSFSTDPETVHGKMAQDGFWSLFDEDTDAVNHLARLSCWSSVCLSRDVQDQLCREQGFTLMGASERLLRLCDLTKFKFFGLDRHERPLTLA